MLQMSTIVNQIKQVTYFSIKPASKILKYALYIFNQITTKHYSTTNIKSTEGLDIRKPDLNMKSRGNNHKLMIRRKRND